MSYDFDRYRVLNAFVELNKPKVNEVEIKDYIINKGPKVFKKLSDDMIIYYIQGLLMFDYIKESGKNFELTDKGLNEIIDFETCR